MKRLLPLLLFSFIAAADPGPATRWLMNERASLLDIGIIRLDLHLESDGEYWSEVFSSHLITVEQLSADEIPFVHTIGAHYDYDDDLIVAWFSARYGQELPKGAVEACKWLLNSQNRSLSDAASRWFGHYGYVNTSRPENLDEQIDGRVELRCEVHGTDQAVNVRRRLGSDQVFVGEENRD